MNINLTLIGQMFGFFLFTMLTMKYVWPPLKAAMDERQKTIADGLAAAEEGAKAKEKAEAQVEDELKAARAQAAEIISKAEKRANEIVDEAKTDARGEGDKILANAQSEIDREVNTAKEGLRTHVSALAIQGAQQILGREIDGSAHTSMLDDLARQL